MKTTLQTRISQELSTEPRRLDVTLASYAPYESDAYHALKALEALGLVEFSWNTHGNTFVRRIDAEREVGDSEARTFTEGPFSPPPFTGHDPVACPECDGACEKARPRRTR